MGIYSICYALILVCSVLIVSIDNYDFATSVSAVLTTLNNVGPGILQVGPVARISLSSPGCSKLVFCADMLLGRLEIFPCLVLLAPELWNGNFKTKCWKKLQVNIKRYKNCKKNCELALKML